MMGALGDWRALARWFACQQPERRPDENTAFHMKCNGCAIVYESQQAPPPPGAFVRWHETWDPKVLESMRDGDLGRAFPHRVTSVSRSRTGSDAPT